MSPASLAGWYSYAVVRVVPRVEREEFVNVGVVLFSRAAGLLCARVEPDRRRILALDATADLDAIERHLAIFDAVCRGSAASGPIGELPVAERFHWLTAPRSTLIQTSAVHEGYSQELDATLAELFARYVAHDQT